MVRVLEARDLTGQRAGRGLIVRVDRLAHPVTADGASLLLEVQHLPLEIPRRRSGEDRVEGVLGELAAK